jgi:hypothetical protein
VTKRIRARQCIEVDRIAACAGWLSPSLAWEGARGDGRSQGPSSTSGPGGFMACRGRTHDVRCPCRSSAGTVVRRGSR